MPSPFLLTNNYKIPPKLLALLNDSNDIDKSCPHSLLLVFTMLANRVKLAPLSW
jgi:hypothetical protein